MLNTILTRRSIRKYTDQPLTEQELEGILRAGMYAPSARNARPWRFVVVDDRAQLDALRQAHPYAGALETAPLAIVLCGQPQGSDWFDDYWQQDCGACAENMLLAAHDMGLGGLWMGVYPDGERRAAFRQILALPDGVEPFCALAFGHPDQPARQPERYDPALVHHNRW